MRAEAQGKVELLPSHVYRNDALLAAGDRCQRGRHTYPAQAHDHHRRSEMGSATASGGRDRAWS